MKSILKYFPSAVVLLFAACSPTEQVADGEDSFNADSLRKHIAVLAADDFQGRKPFTEGETKTIAYLQKIFKETGLEPGNGESYIQDVPMVNIRATAAPAMQVKTAKGSISLKAFDDYVIWTDKTDPSISLDNNEVIFAGYGVIAPEYNWNDYAGLDVKGKVVMVMVNDPGFASGDSTLFKGKTMTYYGRWTYKFEEAARQGAKGCLIVHNTAAASYPFAVPQNNFNTSRLQLDNRGKDIMNCDVVGWVAEPVAKKLLLAGGADTTLLEKAHHRGFKSVPLNLKLTTKMEVEGRYDKSYNVVGKITGSKHPDEVIIYTAHWDHLGIGTKDEKGDSIYNGALDNASGTAGLIELGRAFKSLKSKPERTIVFIAVTAEEQGLWGSAYYAKDPIYPVEKTVANINMDGLNPLESTHDIIIIGKGQSELEDYLKEEVEKAGRYISFDSHPEAGSYFRSDHFNFAKVGVPALFAGSGVDVVGKGKEFGKKREDEYTAKKYHRPSDEYDAANWTFAGGMDDLKLFFRLGKRLAHDEKMPKWKAGSEFKAIREGK